MKTVVFQVGEGGGVIPAGMEVIDVHPGQVHDFFGRDGVWLVSVSESDTAVVLRNAHETVLIVGEGGDLTGLDDPQLPRLIRATRSKWVSVDPQNIPVVEPLGVTIPPVPVRSALPEPAKPVTEITVTKPVRVTETPVWFHANNTTAAVQQTRSAQVMLITSPLRGIGVTTLATHCAATLGAQGHSVILVGHDDTPYQMLGMSVGTGWNTPLPDGDQVPGVDVRIVAGNELVRVPPTQSALSLDRLCSETDYMIVDAPPEWYLLAVLQAGFRKRVCWVTVLAEHNNPNAATQHANKLTQTCWNGGAGISEGRIGFLDWQTPSGEVTTLPGRFLNIGSVGHVVDTAITPDSVSGSGNLAPIVAAVLHAGFGSPLK